MAEIADAAFAYQQALEKGDKKIVGVNVHTATVATDLEILRISHEVELASSGCWPSGGPRRDQAARRRGDRRDGRGRPRTDENMIPAMLDAARAEATLGEICDALRDQWGTTANPPASSPVDHDPVS